jgi:hypothetical protein
MGGYVYFFRVAILILFDLSCTVVAWRDHSEDLGIDGKIVLKWIVGKYVGKYELDPSGSGEGLVAGCYDHANESSGFMKFGVFLDYLNDY